MSNTLDRQEWGKSLDLDEWLAAECLVRFLLWCCGSAEFREYNGIAWRYRDDWDREDNNQRLALGFKPKLGITITVEAGHEASPDGLGDTRRVSLAEWLSWPKL